MDLIVLNGYGPAPFCNGPRVLLSNVSEPMNWIQVKLEGKKSNRDAVGATVIVKSGEIQTTKQQTGGIHCFTQNTQILHFGMNNEHIVEELTIRWPSQRVQKFFDLNVNSRVIIREPDIGLNLEPEEVIIPINGYLTVNVWLQNHSDSEKRFFYGSKIKLPNGKMYPKNKDFLFGPQEIMLLPNQLKSIQATHQIPTTAPIGFYTYYGYVGSSIKDIWTQHAFNFNVTADYRN
jgi:hypothetical protein